MCIVDVLPCVKWISDHKYGISSLLYTWKNRKQWKLRNHSQIHTTSIKDSQGLPMAIRKDWRLLLTSGGSDDKFDIGGAPGAPGAEGGATRRALARLASVSLPLPPDLPPGLSFSFLLLPDALLPVSWNRQISYCKLK